MYGQDDVNKKGSFPDPLAPQQSKEADDYGLQYAKSIHSQWGKMNEASSLFEKRNKIFERESRVLSRHVRAIKKGKY